MNFQGTWIAVEDQKKTEVLLEEQLSVVLSRLALHLRYGEWEIAHRIISGVEKEAAEEEKETGAANAFDTSIAYIPGLGVRLVNALEEHYIFHVRSLLRLPVEEFFGFKNMGEANYRHLRRMVSEFLERKGVTNYAHFPFFNQNGSVPSGDGEHDQSQKP